MKKILFAVSVLGLSGSAFAVGQTVAFPPTADAQNSVCNVGTAVTPADTTKPGKAPIYGGSGYVLTALEEPQALFIKQGFEVQCSSNTIMDFVEVAGGLEVRVASVSQKGNQTFGATSNGGETKAFLKCVSGTTADQCTATDVTATFTELAK